jgi:hypothetical protein
MLVGTGAAFQTQCIKQTQKGKTTTFSDEAESNKLLLLSVQ